jgi:hypothetical protein
VSNFLQKIFTKSKFSCGSALLLVFVVSFVLSLAAMRCWHVSSLVCDIQCQRELFYKQFYITDRILNAGISLACENFDNFLQLKKTDSSTQCFQMSSYLSVDEISKFYKAQFTVSKIAKRFAKWPDCLVLSASLICKNETVCNLRCLLERNVNGKDNVNALSNKFDQDPYKIPSSGAPSFVISHYTLSSSL